MSDAGGHPPREFVVVQANPGWTRVAGPGLVTLAVVVAAVALDFGVHAGGSSVHWIEGVIAGLPCLWFLVRVVIWRLTTLTLTNRSLVVRRGFSRRVAVGVALDAVDRVEVDRTMWGRLAGTGSLRVLVTAPDREDRVLSIHDVRHPDALARIITRRLPRSGDGTRPYPSGYRP